MTDIASLGIEVDTTDVEQGESALDKLTQAGGRAEDATRKLEKATRDAGASARSAAQGDTERAAKANAFFDSLKYGKAQTNELAKANETLAATSKGAAVAQNTLSGASNILANSIKLAVIAFGSFQLVSYAREAALLSARYETLGVVMRVVGNNAGYTANEMEAAAKGVAEMGITMVESRQQVTRLVQAQIDLSSASKLARIAQDAAVIGNINSTEAFGRLIHGIQSGQSETLRLMGINVTAERSYKSMANQLGVTVSQLSQGQRTQAILNAVLAEGSKIAGVYEASLSTAGKQMQSVSRYGDNLKLTLGETFNDALVIAVEAVTAGMKGLTKEARDLAEKGQLRDWGRSAIMVVANVVDGFRFLVNIIKQAYGGIAFLAEATKLAVTGQWEALSKLRMAQEEENKQFVQGITLASDLAQARFDLIDAEKQHAASLADSTKGIKKHGDETLVDAAAIKKAKEEYDKLIQSIREKIAVNSQEVAMGRSLNDAEKTTMDVMVKIRDGVLKLTNAQKERITATLEALHVSQQDADNMQFSKNAAEELSQAGSQQVLNLKEQIEAQRQQNAMLGMTNEQILASTGARELELATNLRNAAAYAGPLHDAYMQYANDLEKVASLQKDLVNEQQIQKNAEEWKRIGTTIEQTGKMAFIQFAAHGTDAMKSIGEAIKLSIYDLLYQLTIRKWTLDIGTSFMSSMTSGAGSTMGGGLGSMLGSGVSSLTGAVGSTSNMFGLMNLASGAQSLFSAFTGGASSLVTAIGTSAIGQALGLGVSGGSALGAGVGVGGIAGIGGAGAGAGTAFIGGAGTALGGTGMTTAGLSGMGSMLAAAAGPLAIAAAADAIFRLIAGNKTIKGADFLTYVPVIGPMINALFGMGPKKLGTPELTGNFTEQGFQGQFEADWKRSGAIFSFGKKKGRRGLGISGEQDAALDAMVGDISDGFKELVDTAGNADRSLTGWNFTFRHAIDTEERQKRLTDELTNSIGLKLIPELSLLQQKDENLADTAARLNAEFKLVNAVLDITGMTINQVGLASLTTRDNLVQMLGGFDAASSSLNSFFENYYTDAERVASTTRLVNEELTKLGFTTLPTTREQFRALVEAQDLNTDAGQKMFASLMQLAPAFAGITDAVGQAAIDAASAAANLAAEVKRVADSIRLLTTDSFKTLFEYTRYIRLAQNAGVTAAMPQGPIFEAPAETFMPSFAVGSDSLPSDMTAKMHKDERIIPAKDNKQIVSLLRSNSDSAGEIKMLREDQQAQALSFAKNQTEMNKELKEIRRRLRNWDSGAGTSMAVKVMA